PGDRADADLRAGAGAVRRRPDLSPGRPTDPLPVMSVATATSTAPRTTRRWIGPSALGGVLRSPRMSGSLVAGLVMLGLIGVLAVVGPRFVNPRLAAVGAVKPSQPPSAQYFLGTDSQGRDMLTIMVLATPQTLRIGLIAGVVGMAIGLTLGLLS